MNSKRKLGRKNGAEKGGHGVDRAFNAPRATSNAKTQRREDAKQQRVRRLLKNDSGVTEVKNPNSYQCIIFYPLIFYRFGPLRAPSAFADCSGTLVRPGGFGG
jgi:hypothetical protein